MYIIFVNILLNDYLINYISSIAPLKRPRSHFGISHFGPDVIHLNCFQAKKEFGKALTILYTKIMFHVFLFKDYILQYILVNDCLVYCLTIN